MNGLVRTAIALSVLAFALDAAADRKTADVCVAASEDGQLLKVKRQLRAAREKLVSCAREGCPKLVRQDCSAALDEVERALPSVVFSALDPKGKDLTNVTITIDGEPLVSELDGKAVAVDPGEHTFVFETPGEQPHSEKVLVREGEKSRVIQVTLGSAPPTSEPVETPPPKTTTESHGPSTATWVVGGAGAAVLVASGAIGIIALQKRSSLYDRCGKDGTCQQSEVDSVYRLYDISYAGAAIGGALLATGVVLYFTSKKTSERQGLVIGPTLGGINVSGKF